MGATNCPQKNLIMATFAYFISENTLKEQSLINENVDMKMIQTTIRMCQELYILPLMGTGLYNALMDKINTDPTLATETNYKTLLDNYIQPALVYWVMSEMPAALTYRYSNKAVMVNSSENGQAANATDIERLSDNNKDKAQAYSSRLTMYLVANASTFPLFDNPGNSIDTIIPIRNSFSKGMYLGEPRETFGLPIFSDREHYMR
mgnify:CR=1 FL=1